MKFDNYIVQNNSIAYTLPLCCPTSAKEAFSTAFRKLKRKHTAFTLAETLVTLTIIGVIAAITVPNLII